MPSALLKVACVGQTRTQGGFSQWLQRAGTGSFVIDSGNRGWASAGKICSTLSRLIQWTSSLGFPKLGTLCSRWQAVMQSVQPGLHFLGSTVIAQRFAVSAGRGFGTAGD